MSSKTDADDDDQNKSISKDDTAKPSLFGDLFSKQMRNFQKVSSADDYKRYLTESVVDPDMLVKERTGINGVLGWWKVSLPML